MNESPGVIVTPDGRDLAYAELGDPAGPAIFEMHGCPGSRLDSKVPDPGIWRRCGARLITWDRPGYGRSSRLPGRSVADCAQDAEAVADALGIGQFFVTGTSGGGPHALAVAALLGDRVLGCAAVCSFAPLEEAELSQLIPINRESYWRVRQEGWRGLADDLGPVREMILAHPQDALESMLEEFQVGSYDLDKQELKQSLVASVVEALSPGVEGWADDSYAINLHWAFDPSRIDGVPVTFRLADLDNATPQSAVRRLAAAVPRSRVIAWPGEGHIASVVHKRQVIEELLGYRW